MAISAKKIAGKIEYDIIEPEEPPDCWRLRFFDIIWKVRSVLMKNRVKLMDYLQRSTDIPFGMYNVTSDIFYTTSSESLDEMCRYMLKRFQEKGCDALHPLALNSGNIFYCGMMQINHNSYLMLGPVCPTRYQSEYIRAQLQDDITNEIDKTIFMMTHGTIGTLDNMKNTICLASHIIDEYIVSYDDIYVTHLEFKKSSLQTILADYQYHKSEENEVPIPIRYEEYFQDSITQGDRVSLEMFLAEPLQGTIGTMSKNPQVQERYLFITAATLWCRAAIAGGVNQEKACAISDIYCQQMDELPDGTDYGFLYIGLMNAYIDSVKESRNPDFLSTSVSMVKDYISQHIQDNISIKDVAENCGLSSRRIAKKFVDEMGMSIKEYLHQCRMERASQMLKYTNYSISDISNILQYSTQSYFTEHFRSRYHMTPKKYREHYRK